MWKKKPDFSPNARTLDIHMSENEVWALIPLHTENWITEPNIKAKLLTRNRYKSS
jgi:hypothetical protein